MHQIRRPSVGRLLIGQCRDGIHRTLHGYDALARSERGQGAGK
jgi:hypothetical protein